MAEYGITFTLLPPLKLRPYGDREMCILFYNDFALIYVPDAVVKQYIMLSHVMNLIFVLLQLCYLETKVSALSGLEST